jgi:steroid 5-alpha reductase family enzyme
MGAFMNDKYYIILGPILLIHLFFGVAVLKKNLSVIDTAWGLGFILMGSIGSILSQWHNLREVVVLTMVILWGLRLSLFIHLRNLGKGEDFRYANWRKDWGEKTNFIAYFKVYWLQIFLMFIVGLPIFAAHESTDPDLNWINILGIIIWLLGLSWESVADYQKNKFKSNPANHNKVFQGGVWEFSRHPNYFGEALLWWGISLVSLDGQNSWALIGPAFLTLLLWKVSGVPLVEQRHAGNPEYQAYKARTPVLIPSFKIMLRKQK